jgi:histidinol-phosphate aminotransferase
VACCGPEAVAEADAWACELVTRRAHLLAQLNGIRGVDVAPDPRGSFVLLRIATEGVQKALRDKGFAVRRGDTFPGLGPEWIRVAVRDEATSAAFAAALKEIM